MTVQARRKGISSSTEMSAAGIELFVDSTIETELRCSGLRHLFLCYDWL